MEQTQPRTIADIVRELDVQTVGMNVILDTIEGFNPVLNSTAAQQNVLETNAFLDLVSTAIFNIDEGIGKVLGFFTGRQLQEEENRRELIEALNNLGEGRGRDPVPPPAPREENGPVEWLMKLGAITGIGASFGVFAGFMGEMFKFLQGTRGIIGKMLTPVKWLWSKGIAFFKSFSEGFTSLIGHLQNAFENSKFTKPISDMIKYIRSTSDLGGGLSKLAKKVVEFFSKIGQNIAKFGKAFLWGSKLGVLLAKVFKAIAYPITIVMAAYATIIGAVKGFKEDNIMGAFKGGFTGLLVNLVGEIVDLVKDGVSWVSKMLGFKNFSKMLDGFSFSELLGTGVNAIFDTIQYTWDYLTGLFSPDKLIKSFMDGGFAGLIAMIGGGVLDMVKGAISWLATILGAFDIANALDNFSIQDYLMKGVQTMIDFVSASIDAIVTLFETAPQLLTDAINSANNIAEEFAKNVLKSVLPRVSDHQSMTDPLHWVGKAIPDSVYRFAGMQTPEDFSKGINYENGKNPYEERAKELKERDIKFQKDVDILNDYIKGTPSNAGATLNETSSTTSNMPIIINNMGGNVTNTSMSSVNNNTSPFEPILAGSSMGFSSF